MIALSIYTDEERLVLHDALLAYSDTDDDDATVQRSCEVAMSILKRLER